MTLSIVGRSIQTTPRSFAHTAVARLALAMTLALIGEVSALGNPMEELGELGELEKKALNATLEQLSLEIDPAPEGKIIGELHVRNREIFAKNEGFFTLLNYLHRTTRPYTVEREVLLRPGDLWDWSRVAETQRNLNDPLLSILVVLVPVRSDKPGTVDLLVVTRDSWSLRTDSAFEIQAGVLSKLIMEPSDFNFLGLRKQVGARFIMDLGDYRVGPLLYDRNIMGTRIRSSLFAGLVFNRQTSAMEGSVSEIDIDYPLWSLERTWGARMVASHQIFVSRLFQDTDLYTYDAPETPDDDQIPWAFDMREFSLDTEVVRATGNAIENRFTLGHELRVQRPSIRDGFIGTDAVREAFTRDVLPRSELTSAAVLRYHMFTPTFGRYRHVETFDLVENHALGPDVTLETALGSRFLGSEIDFVRLRGDVTWTEEIAGAGFAQLRLSASTRIEDADARDTELDVEAKLVSPPISGAFRVLGRARLARRFDDRQNIVFPLGGETGLRGYVIGAFVGRALGVANVELRTSPISYWVFKSGATLFYDVGHAADSIDQLSARHNIGIGLRLMMPQVGRELLRIDWAIPLNGPTAGFPGRISVGFAQVF